MENLRLQLAGVGGAGQSTGSSLADQLGGEAMDLKALNLKVGLQHRSILMGLSTAYLRVLSDQDNRATELMKA